MSLRVTRRAIRDFRRAWRSVREILDGPADVPRDPGPGEKRCTVCRAVKPHDAFCRGGRKSDGHGLQSYCRPCQHAMQAEFRRRRRARAPEGGGGAPCPST